MNMILSADQNWGIGYQSDLLCKLPGDMAFFKKMTTGKTVVMGRATLQSLPGEKPLPNRRNIVLTTNRNFKVEGAEICHTLSALLALAENADTEIFIIGGETIYRQCMPYCGKAYVTRIDASFPADRFMADLDATPGWTLAESSKTLREKGVDYRFCTYVHTNGESDEQS